MFLRDVFSAWDELSERRTVEKIKTIGDAYMCVGGLTEDDIPCGAKLKGRIVAYEMVMLGLEMKRALDQVNAKHGTTFQVRIGIHTGPCIAGVIGVKRFAFDIWGDAVNVASRMESHGVPGSVHISYDTYAYIKHSSYLKFTCRGENHVKGKGVMTTYLVDIDRDLNRRSYIADLGYEIEESEKDDYSDEEVKYRTRYDVSSEDWQTYCSMHSARETICI